MVQAAGIILSLFTDSGISLVFHKKTFLKLFTRYNRLNLLATVIIFLVASFVFYFFIRSALISQLDDDLEIEKKEIETYVKEYDKLPEVVPVRHQIIRYTKIILPFKGVKFGNFEATDSSKNEKDNFRSLDFGVRTQGNEYMVSVMKPMETTETLLWSLLLIVLSTIIVILLSFYIINRIVLKKLWMPFFDTLSKVKFFSVGKNETLQFHPTKIEEFNLMNHTLETTTNKAQQDYLILKEFTENASHEMQTPLAIIQSKLDLLIQDEHLSETQSTVAQSVYESIQKLSRLNQSLLLLTKIRNSQFEEVIIINMKEKIEKKTEAFQELWVNKKITTTISLQDIPVKMNKALADILLNNLLSNATKHNFSGGSIHIELNETCLTVSNTGHKTALDNSRLYTKFYTENKSAGNTGLGLSIVKHICDASGFSIIYSNSNHLHSFSVNW